MQGREKAERVTFKEGWVDKKAYGMLRCGIKLEEVKKVEENRLK